MCGWMNVRSRVCSSFVSSVFTEFIVKTASTLYVDVYPVSVRALLSLSMPKRLLTKIAILPKVNKYNVINYWLCGSRKYVKVNIRQVDESCYFFREGTVSTLAI